MVMMSVDEIGADRSTAEQIVELIRCTPAGSRTGVYPFLSN
jgi:S-ribosylhomocysteine lyase LuxS involved in autoinducer biosynthesis